MAVPLGEVHPDVRAAVRALIDNYGALGVINIVVQLSELDKHVAYLEGDEGSDD